MDLFKHPGKKYKQFRSRQRYDSPMLIFVVDMLLGLSKLLLICIVLTAGWVASKKHPGSVVTEPTKTTNASIQSNSATEPSVNTESETQQKPDTRSLNSTNTESTIAVSQNATVEQSVNTKTETPKKSGTSPSNSTNTEPAIATSQNVTVETPRADQQGSNKSSPQILSEDPMDDDNRSKMLDETWILQLNPASHIIQIGASTDLAALQGLIPDSDFKEPTAVYPYTRTLSDEIVYGIAVGLYETHDAASAAVENMSEVGRAYKPWIRQVEDITKEIENMDTRKQAQD